jgi:hypothetical protein
MFHSPPGKRKYPVFLSCILFLLWGSLFAQQPILKNFNVKDGLPSSEVYCSFQDSRGFIWFGTDGGVTCFDGYTFKNYTTEDGLVDNTVFGITEDHQQRIWFRSLSGKICFLKNDSIYSLGCNDSISGVIKNAIVVSLYVDSGDTIWCGLRSSEGYFKINPGYKAKDFQYVKLCLSGFYIVSVERSRYISGSLVCSDASPELYLFNKSKLLSQAHLDKSFLVSGMISEQIQGDTFLVSNRNKPLLLIGNKLSTACLPAVKSSGDIIALRKTGAYYWIGSTKGGVLRCNSYLALDGGIGEKILADLSVSDVLVDDEGGTWFTTLENGVY